MSTPDDKYKTCNNCDNFIVVNNRMSFCDITGICISKFSTCSLWNFNNKKINILNI